MAGTVAGGKLAAKTNKERFGKDFYAKIGKIGGHNSNNGGFAAGEEGKRLARIAGAKGGKVSRKGWEFKGVKTDGSGNVYKHKRTGEYRVFGI